MFSSKLGKSINSDAPRLGVGISLKHQITFSAEGSPRICTYTNFPALENFSGDAVNWKVLLKPTRLRKG